MIERTSLIERVLSANPRVIRLIAPAGYGKSTLTHDLGKRFPVFAECDCLDVAGAPDFCKRIMAALAREHPQRADELAQQALSTGDDLEAQQAMAFHAWAEAHGRSLFAFENAEEIAAHEGICQFLPRLVARGPSDRVIAICSRAALQLHFGRTLAPHDLMTLGTDELRLSDDEVREAFSGLDVLPEAMSRVAEVSRGWAIAVFLLARFAREGKLEPMLDQLEGVAFSDLRDYLTTEVLSGLPRPLFDVLLACVALPRASAEDVRCALNRDAAEAELAELNDRLPFVRRLKDGTFEIAPLLGATLRARHAQRCRDLLVAAADCLLERDRPVRAARLYIALGDRESAARALEHGVQGELGRLRIPSIELADVLGAFDQTTLARHPLIWAEVTVWRAGAIEPNERVRQCEAMLRSLPPDASTELRGSVVGAYQAALVNLGRYSDAERSLNDFASALKEDETLGRSVVDYLRIFIDVKLHGSFANVEPTLAHLFPMLSATGSAQPFVLAQAVGWIHTARGEFDVASRAYDQAIELAFATGLTLLKATILLDSIESSWVAGDDAAFKRRVSQFEALMDPAVARFSTFFIAAAHGELDDIRPGFETVERVTFGRLMASASATLRADAERHARLALDAAERSSQPFLRVLARVALGELAAGERRMLMKEASDLASGIESKPLQDAVAAVRAGSGGFGMLAAFVARFRKHVAVAVDGERLAQSLPAKSPLSKREREVAALVAAGKSNREIGEVLVISERTVENHVASMFNKLGIGSRAALAAYIASQGEDQKRA